MKRNVQIYDKEQLSKILNGWGFEPIMNPTITKDGDYIYTSAKMDRTGGRGGNWRLKECVMSSNDIAHLINMPLWEVIMVDNGAHDEYALLFYEEG